LKKVDEPPIKIEDEGLRTSAAAPIVTDPETLAEINVAEFEEMVRLPLMSRC